MFSDSSFKERLYTSSNTSKCISLEARGYVHIILNPKQSGDQTSVLRQGHLSICYYRLRNGEITSILHSSLFSDACPLFCQQHWDFSIDRRWKLEETVPRSKVGASSGSGSTARMNSFKLMNTELLVDETNLKVNRIGRRQIDLDFIDIEPKEQSLHLNPFQISD